MDIDKIKQGLAPAIWGAIAGAIAVCVVGFNWGGWVTGGTATEMAQAAIVDRLVPICMVQFNRDSAKAVKPVEMKKGESWRYADFVAKQGWATMPDAKEANDEVAERCASQIAS